MKFPLEILSEKAGAEDYEQVLYSLCAITPFRKNWHLPACENTATALANHFQVPDTI